MGFIASWIGLFFGAVGTFVGAMFLSEPLEKKEMVATQAACQSLLHFTKIVVFVYLGFSYGGWWGLLALLFISILAGTFLGTKILNKIPQDLFMVVFKSLLVILSLRLVVVGLQSLLLYLDKSGKSEISVSRNAVFLTNNTYRTTD